MSEYAEMLAKAKTLSGEELLEYVRKSPCIKCGKSPPSDPDHIKTRGAGGKDTQGNVWPLCRRCHTKRHSVGLLTFIKQCPPCRAFLMLWGREDVLRKL